VVSAVADTLKSFYIDCIENLLVQNKLYINGQIAQMKIKYNPNAMFVYPVTEHKLNRVAVVDTLKSFYIDCIENLLVQNKFYINGQTAQMKIKYNPNAMFVYPVTEHKLNQVK
jgi:hypothetical protein